MDGALATDGVGIEVRWEVDSFFPDSAEPEMGLVDQAVVTTMAKHIELPPRRYPWGRPESKYIESPNSSACS